ncbi:hypothetical protein FA15DRAFT_672330 [Coprinopsis marcescibilis]|uniref:Uncharacterized protein n=1 Tax=Coprinopsis marcescibilis TaxID=230819 RepID=A0A5C3KN27_COPMA|nr:hypothetical protein FA15DRAFT_672330 [Coprinopsis marcescibilis]
MAPNPHSPHYGGAPLDHSSDDKTFASAPAMTLFSRNALVSRDSISTTTRNTLILAVITVAIIFATVMALYAVYKGVRFFQRRKLVNQALEMPTSPEKLQAKSKSKTCRSEASSARTSINKESIHQPSPNNLPSGIQSHLNTLDIDDPWMGSAPVSNNLDSQPSPTSVDLFRETIPSSGSPGSQEGAAEEDITSTSAAGSITDLSAASLKIVGDDVVGAYPFPQDIHPVEVGVEDTFSWGVRFSFPWVTEEMRFGLVLPTYPVDEGLAGYDEYSETSAYSNLSPPASPLQSTPETPPKRSPTLSTIPNPRILEDAALANANAHAEDDSYGLAAMNFWKRYGPATLAPPPKKPRGVKAAHLEGQLNKEQPRLEHSPEVDKTNQMLKEKSLHKFLHRYSSVVLLNGVMNGRQNLK